MVDVQLHEMNSEFQGGASIEHAAPTEVPPPPVSGERIRFYQPVDWLSFGVTALAALVIYLITLAPDVTLRFSGILATGANYAGVPHPPGFPVWTIYAWLFTKLLPFSNIAWRVAVSSAVAGAVGCGLVALMVSRGGALVLESTGGIKRFQEPKERWLRGVCGVAAGMGLALDQSVWSQAVIVESWTLALLFLAAVLCLLLRWTHEPNKMLYCYGAVFL